MARRYSSHIYTVNDLKISLRFEAEELNEQHLVVDENLSAEITKYFQDTFSLSAEHSLEQTAQTIHGYVEHQLHADTTNVYKNLMGDEYPRVRIVSVDVTGTYTATYGD